MAIMLFLFYFYGSNDDDDDNDLAIHDVVRGQHYAFSRYLLRGSYFGRDNVLFSFHSPSLAYYISSL